MYVRFFFICVYHQERKERQRELSDFIRRKKEI